MCVTVKMRKRECVLLSLHRCAWSSRWLCTHVDLVMVLYCFCNSVAEAGWSKIECAHEVTQLGVGWSRHDDLLPGLLVCAWSDKYTRRLHLFKILMMSVAWKLVCLNIKNKSFVFLLQPCMLHFCIHTENSGVACSFCCVFWGFGLQNRVEQR